MSFDEYVNHISQKYRLAVAISVIKTKPNSVSIEEYLTQLQRKINTESDPNETVCSDDFNFDDDCISQKANNEKIDTKSNEKHIHPENEDVLMSDTILGDFVFEDKTKRAPVGQKESSVIGDTLKLLKTTDDTQIDDKGPFVDEQTFVQNKCLFKTLSGNAALDSINNMQLYRQDSSQVTFCESQAEILNVPNTTFCYSMPNSGYLLKLPENIDTQKTEIYTLQGFTQDCTHVSQTQEQHFFIPNKFIRNNVQNDKNENQIIVTADIDYKNTNKEVILLDNQIINRDANNKHIEETQIRNDKLDKHPIENESENIYKNIQECDEMVVDEQTDSDADIQVVKVPFKVLEELNNVRSYLKKERRNTEGYSTDSGYRSDSQLRCSFKTSSQNSQGYVWLNQSAHSLFSHIVQAPTASDDITSEISQVLGQLIDKLHEEEKYPPFLEELLETVDNLIRDVHEGESCDGDVLLTKDENLHRLNHLNKSKHILRHTIAHITKILEKLHASLTQENLYELTNTTEIENISYIFHMLEIFLKRYVKLKNVSSQVKTQNSQEDAGITKRSSLTDLWRKKWNPNYKETSTIQDNVTVCVLKRCGEVLNKIIVECIEGYSLLAYAALQCFNVLQP